MRWSRGASLASFLALASCDGPGVTSFMPALGDLPTLKRTVQTLVTLRDARDHWRAAAPTRYRLEQQVICFCDVTGVRVLEVVDTVVTRAWDRSTLRASAVMTRDLAVERVFDRAIAALEGGGYVSAAFDATYGYPRDIYIDPLPWAADDEANYRLAALTPF